MWFYLSFADPDLPKGSQFLGACYVEADSEVQAVRTAHARGCNPGGEVLIGEVPTVYLEEHVLPEDRYRLLTRDELAG